MMDRDAAMEVRAFGIQILGGRAGLEIPGPSKVGQRVRMRSVIGCVQGKLLSC